jgi:predicted MFS family arabinose efflux permease
LSLLGSPERRLTILVGSISFVTSIVYSIVGALAPMFFKDLAIPSQDIGTIAGVYSLAGAFSGFLGSLFLDRFDRRTGLAISISGVVVGVLLTALAPNREFLIAARILSGMFSGPSSAFSIAIIIDNVPVERRGTALGSITSFQALGQILGLPAGLVLANMLNSWRFPFFAIAGIGAVLAAWVILNLAPQRAHLEGRKSFAIDQRLRLMGELLTRRNCLVAWGIQLTGIVPLVAITTIMSVFLVNNLGYPNDQLPTLYIIGGGSNLVFSWIIGRAIDRFGATIVSVASSILLTAAIVFGYMGVNPGIPLLVIFPVFFFTSSARLVVGQTVTMRIPRNDERAGFQSLGQSIQAFAMAASAMAIPYLLGSTPDGKLTGINPFASGVIVVTWIFPFLVAKLVQMLDRARPAAATPIAGQQAAE